MRLIDFSQVSTSADVLIGMKHETLIALVLSGMPAVSRELADLVVAGDAAEGATPAPVALFSRPLVEGELETLISEALDAEELASHTVAQICA